MIGAMMLAAFTLVSAEKSATVVVPENAEPSTMLCVEELTNYVAKITGVILEVKVRGQGQERSDNSTVQPSTSNLQPQIFIGTLTTLGDKVPAVAKKALEATEKFEAGWMGTVDGNLWIVGKETTADMYLMYHFLETKLGIRWFQAAVPEDPGDWYPSSKSIVLDDFTEFREPDFLLRRFGHQSAEWDVTPITGDTWLFRNGYQMMATVDFFGVPENKNPKTSFEKKREISRAFYSPRFSRRFVGTGGHIGCYRVFPCEKYAKTDPDLFALSKGERKSNGGHYQHYCTSNPKLLDGMVKYYTNFFKKNGGRGTYWFGMADTAHGWCECENCRKLDGEGESPNGNVVNVSSRMVWFASRLFDRIHAECPDVDFNYEPYAVFRTPPKRGKMPDYTRCQYSPHGRCYGHTFDDPKCMRNAPLWKEMMTWRGMLPRSVWAYDYLTCTPSRYICSEIREAKDLKRYKELGMIGWYNEGAVPGSKFVDGPKATIVDEMPSNWQWVYATGHLLWNVDQDVLALVEEAESKYYGVAYPPMKKYHALRRELWEGRNECMGYPYGDPRRPLLLNAEGAKEKLLAYLDEAEKLAAADKVLRYRLSRDRYWLDKYWIKPNDKARYELAHALNVPKLGSSVTIDGDPSDKAWEKAQDVTDRLRVEGRGPRSSVLPPDFLKAKVRLGMDEKNLYFLCQADEPDMAHVNLACKKLDDPVYGDDCFEFMIFPPAVENCYYHIAVSADGVVYDSRCPGEDTKYNLGVEAKGVKSEKGWCIEVRVPSEKLMPLVDGDVWRMQIGRCRPGRRRPTNTSLDGYQFPAQADFLSFRIGRDAVKESK